MTVDNSPCMDAERAEQMTGPDVSVVSKPLRNGGTLAKKKKHNPLFRRRSSQEGHSSDVGTQLRNPIAYILSCVLRRANVICDSPTYQFDSDGQRGKVTFLIPSDDEENSASRDWCTVWVSKLYEKNRVMFRVASNHGVYSDTMPTNKVLESVNDACDAELDPMTFVEKITSVFDPAAKRR